MAKSRRRRIPKMQLHKTTGRAVVRLGGRDVYLGRYGTAKAETAYPRRPSAEGRV